MLATLSTQREKEILETAHVIAVVGHSNKPYRPSYTIADYLRKIGYKVYAVNPNVKSINGETCYPDLKSLPEKPDIVNIFRRSKHLLEHVKEATAIGAPVVWAQLGVHDDKAVAYAEEAGIEILTDKCIKVSHIYLL